MLNDQDYIRIKEQAAPELFKIPGVHAVGLGPKFVGGRPVGKLAIQVFVESKLPQSSLKPEEIIPEFIDDVPTDVLIFARTASIQTVDDCRVGVIESAQEILTGSTPTHLELTSTAHGLFDNAVIRITGTGSVTSIPYIVTVKDTNAFVVPIIENGQDKRPVSIPYVANSARWINVSNFDNLCCCPTGPIESVNLAGKVKIRSTAHGLIKGDRVKISKARLPLEPAIHKIERNDKDNFTLVDANPSDFGGSTTGWSWHKVGMAPAGPITGIDRGNPVVVTAPRHGLVKNDKVIILTNDTATIVNLDNLIRRDIGPYVIEPRDPNSFSIPGVDATGWGAQGNDFNGAWIKVIDDRKTYGRKWGGIRLEVKESETETVERTATNPGSSPLTTPLNPRGETVHIEVKLSTGTLGCIAIDNLSGKKVLLSNAHVLDNGTTDDFTVHHPTHYQSSKSCSNHIIAERIRLVHGEDAVHHFTLDAAIAKFDPDKGEYDPFIVDIGPVKGVAPIAPSEIVDADYRVWKRGAQTGITEGIVISTSFGFTARDGRVYRNQLHIHPVSGVFRGFICIQGDSGSVLVNKDNHVVGLIHSATEIGGGIANPIDEVEAGLNIKIWTEPDLVTEGEEPIDPSKQTSEVAIPDLFANTVAELSSTEAGNNLAVIVNSHVVEVMHMISANKRFATLWQRNHGPELMIRVRQAIAARHEPIPSSIQGQSVQEIVSNILGALKRFGSPGLAKHVEQYQQLVFQILNVSYEDVLGLLQHNPQLVPKT